jgi:hypothetical protein
MYRLWFDNRPTPPLTGQADRFLLGRDPVCHLRLLEPGVSGQHAVIERRPDGWHLRDLASATGVRVNDQPVTDQRLATGDRIEIGAVRLRFEVLHESGGRRRFSPLQCAAAIIIAATLLGQLIVVGWVMLQPRSRDMRVSARSHVELAPPAPAPAPGAAPAAPPPAPVAPATPPVLLTRKIRVVELQSAGDTLRIVARAQVGERVLDPKLVAITAEPFAVDAAGRTVSAGAPVAVDIPAWENFSAKTLTVRFSARYDGFVVRTYYRGELQDIAATPPALLALVPR